jgi:hypothetical protein
VSWDAETNSNLRWNCTLNKIRALRHGEDGPTLVCEDDIIFPPRWLSELQRAVAEIEDDRYVLSLHAAQDLLKSAALLPGKQWVKEYPTPALQGAQALYYPNRETRLAVAEYLRANLTEACGDDLIGRYARSYAQLYATKDPVVRNVGAISCFH